MKKISLILLSALALASCVKETPVGQPFTDSQQILEGNVIQGVVVVKLTEDMAEALEQSAGALETKSAMANDMLREFGVTKYSRVFDSDPRWVERERREGLHLYYRLEFDPYIMRATKTATDLSSMPGVQSAEVEHRVKQMYTTTPNDPKFGNQWHLKNSNGYDLNVQKVWAELTQGSPEVIVSVVDGGIKPDHEDLVANFIPGGQGGSKNFVSNNYTITGDSHGTHVGGIIAATTNNGKGVAGIAGGDGETGNKGVRLLSSQVFSGDNSASTVGFANAIKYGADNGAVISQNSWGWNFDTDRDGRISDSEYQIAKNSKIDSYTKNAIDYFIKYAGCDNQGNQLPDSPMKGGVFICAAGNDNIDIGIPANYAPAIAVGAFTSTGAKASFSNYGDWVDICAPGQQIYSTCCENYGQYANMSGTSMACPMVSGVAALIVSYCGGYGFTNEKLEEALIATAKDDIRGTTATTKIGPRVNAYDAVLYNGGSDPGDDNTPPTLTPNFDPSQTKVRGSETKTFTFTVEDAEGHSFVVEYDKANACEIWDRPEVNTLTVTIPAPQIASARTYTTKIKLTDRYEASATYDFTYTILPNNAPVVAAPFDNVLAHVGDRTVKLPLAGKFSDPDGDELEYIINTTAASVARGQVNGDYLDIIFGNGSGEATITVIAQDGRGEQARQTIKALVRARGEDISLYPTQVTKAFTIGTGATLQDTHIEIYSQTGVLVYALDTKTSAFAPAIIDISSLAPGRYQVKVTVGEDKFVKTIVKL